MASVDSISSTTATPDATSTSTTASTSANSQENEFLQLLVAQLQSQNPLDPMDGTQFVSQLAEFSSLQELTGMHSDLDKIQTYLQPASTDTATSSTSPTSSTDSSNSTKPSNSTNSTNSTNSSNPFQTS